MTARSTAQTLPFQLGEPRSYRALTLIPLFPVEPPELEYIGLDEAVAHGFTISEIGADGVVELLAVANPLDDRVLLHEGEEFVGAKQNRIVERSILVEANATLKIPAKCVERGRWSHSTAHFSPAPQAAYPSLRKAQRDGQAAVWAEVSAKALSLGVHSPTEAAEAIYESQSASLDRYAQMLSRLDGQSGVLVGIGGRIVCLDYVSRSDVFAGLYGKLLRGYTLDALGADGRPLSMTAVGRFLGELELVTTAHEAMDGVTERWTFEGHAVGYELHASGETIALTASPSR